MAERASDCHFAQQRRSVGDWSVVETGDEGVDRRIKTRIWAGDKGISVGRSAHQTAVDQPSEKGLGPRRFQAGLLQGVQPVIPIALPALGHKIGDVREKPDSNELLRAPKPVVEQPIRIA
jgi:hypothetical protein